MVDLLALSKNVKAYHEGLKEDPKATLANFQQILSDMIDFNVAVDDIKQMLEQLEDKISGDGGRKSASRKKRQIIELDEKIKEKMFNFVKTVYEFKKSDLVSHLGYDPRKCDLNTAQFKQFKDDNGIKFSGPETKGRNVRYLGLKKK